MESSGGGGQERREIKRMPRPWSRPPPPRNQTAGCHTSPRTPCTGARPLDLPLPVRPISTRCGCGGSGRRPADLLDSIWGLPSLRKEGEWRAKPAGERAELIGGRLLFGSRKTAMAGNAMAASCPALATEPHRPALIPSGGRSATSRWSHLRRQFLLPSTAAVGSDMGSEKGGGGEGSGGSVGARVEGGAAAAE